MTEAPPDFPILTSPAEGFAPVIEDWERLTDLTLTLATELSPVALDAERASGFRYHSWAYLIQLKTPATGIILIDPVALTATPPADLSHLGTVLGAREWIIHAASQDLACLAELGLRPQRLFDTELAARLLGRPRVGLGPLVEDILGVRLLKEHASADWSTRPLPPDWLTYAALDVELLVELRNHLDDELEAAGKRDWAAQEFQYWTNWASLAPIQREEPWRRTAGLHLVRTPRGMAIVRELWEARDHLARELDLAPSRLLKDAGITELAARVQDKASTVGPGDLTAIEWFARRPAQRFRSVWLAALGRAVALDSTDWPPVRRALDGPPLPRAWRSLNPPAAERWRKVRPIVTHQAQGLNLPPENLLSPDALRRLLWEPLGLDAESVRTQLTEYGVRPWQCELVTGTIVEALAPR
jgi:ribonuclease D